MGLRRIAQPLGEKQPELARQLIIAASRMAAPEDAPFEYVYLFRGYDFRDDQPVYKLGRSRRPEIRLKEVRSCAYFADWDVVHRIQCSAIGALGRMRPSEGDTLESLLHGLFTPYRTAQAFGKEYFALPDREIMFIHSFQFIDALSLNVGVLNGSPDHMNIKPW